MFIDDLDRCEVPLSADLLQAINLLTSSNDENFDLNLDGDSAKSPDENLFFILGFDRQMVAAAIAAKNKKALPYLIPSERQTVDLQRGAIDYGYSFMEKFVQVPFRVPFPDGNAEDWIPQDWIPRMLEETATSAGPQPRQSQFRLYPGSDPEGFQNVVEKNAQMFACNPRRVKQFINEFRLQVLIAINIGALIPALGSSSGSRAGDKITLDELGLLTAIFMRWPRIVYDLKAEPNLIESILSWSEHAVKANSTAEKWQNPDLKLLLSPLKGLDLRLQLMVMPSANLGPLGDTDLRGIQTRLVPGHRNGSEKASLGGFNAEGKSDASFSSLNTSNIPVV